LIESLLVTTPSVVNCPLCGKAIEWIPEYRYRPFCSERCKLMDLGAWASEKYRVASANRAPDGEAETGEDQS